MAKPKILNKGYSDRISRLDFSAHHYRGAQFDSDMFYVGVANRLMPVLKSTLDGLPGLKPLHVRRLAINLVCYLEDLVSESGIWEAFLSLHGKKFGKEIPFYDTDDELYSRDFPCVQAVRFLIWYTLNDIDPATILNPKNPAIEILAVRLMTDLTKAYEDAPESPMRPMLLSEKELHVPVFYQFRNICDWLCRGCYLTALTDPDEIEDRVADCLEPVLDSIDNSEDMEEYAIRSYLPFNTLIGPLGVTAPEWLSEIISLHPEESERQFLKSLAEFRSLPINTNKSISEDRSRALLMGLDEKEFELSAFTMNNMVLPPNVEPGSTALMSLVYFNGAWNLNGLGELALPGEIFEKALEEYKRMAESNSKKFKDINKILKNKRIGTAPDFDNLKAVFSLTGAIPDNGVGDAISRDRDFLYFLNSDGNISVIPNFGRAVKICGNELYDKKKVQSEGLSLIFNPDLTTGELREYIISNNLIPDAALNSFTSPEEGHRLFQDNLRFFAAYALRGSVA